MDVFTVVKRNPFVIPLAFIAALAMVFISEGSYWRSVDTLNELGGMASARMNIQSLERGILDAETGQRGYLLTTSRDYLLPYEQSLKKIDDSIQALKKHYRDEPDATSALGEVNKLVQTKLSELALAIRLHDEGNREAMTALVLTGIGKEKMEEIRALLTTMLEQESTRVRQGREDLYRTLMLGRLGVAVLSAISLLALVMYLRESFALEKQQQLQKQLIQQERDQLEDLVAQRTVQLTELTDHLETAREDERSRLARDLHDELGALLTSAKLDAARIKSRLGSTAPEALERLNHLVSTLNSGIELKRRIVENLRPSSLSQLGLVVTLEILAKEFSERSGVKVHSALQAVNLTADAELVVYRLLQEAITNISKYAQAKNVWITLEPRGEVVYVAVRDDGVGFDASQPCNSAYGLLGMRYRVKAEHGTMTLSASPGQGALIEATLPQRHAE